MFSEFETLMDPSRNHRVYRSTLTRLTPPIILFMPLLLKDLTFTHEGNKTYLLEGLVNFEKMVTIVFFPLYHFSYSSSRECYPIRYEHWKSAVVKPYVSQSRFDDLHFSCFYRITSPTRCKESFGNRRLRSVSAIKFHFIDFEYSF